MHHFDLATLTTLPARNADATGYVGVGLSPGDEYYDEPYFYVSVYPESIADRYMASARSRRRIGRDRRGAVCILAGRHPHDGV
jgi:hypothetical protein